ncbi:hypothetical protein N658DRAFT_43190 [Parathielavia hyrcaniae]|uniref:Uncharacterized protein n=1 Tax=Parathielavia hyrcaniae TaxID=113614 RepID=A0AAN6Q571_9PEZI|nr:hypothetical protein N658DRAFT_43190 [Parathielavia hyrcaniae]
MLNISLTMYLTPVQKHTPVLPVACPPFDCDTFLPVSNLTQAQQTSSLPKTPTPSSSSFPATINPPLQRNPTACLGTSRDLAEPKFHHDNRSQPKHTTLSAANTIASIRQITQVLSQKVQHKSTRKLFFIFYHARPNPNLAQADGMGWDRNPSPQASHLHPPSPKTLLPASPPTGTAPNSHHNTMAPQNASYPV